MIQAAHHADTSAKAMPSNPNKPGNVIVKIILEKNSIIPETIGNTVSPIACKEQR